MKDLDLSGVDPLRWAETRARVAAVESYIAIEDPTEAQRIEHAGRLGLGQTQFLNLVRAWRAHGTAVALAGARRQRAPRSQGRSFSEQTERVMIDVLERLGPDVKLTQAVAAVHDACRPIGVTMPSRQTIWRRLMAIRSARGSAAGAGDVIIARCRAKLPALVDGQTILPSLVLAASTFDGRVIASASRHHDKTIEPITEIIRTLDPTTIITVEDSLRNELAGLPVELRIVTHGSARRILARVIGKQLGSLELLYGTGKAADGHLTSRIDQALTLDQVAAVIEAAIREHNSIRDAIVSSVSVSN